RCKLFQSFNFRSAHVDPFPLWINFSYEIAMRKSICWFTRVSNAIALARPVVWEDGGSDPASYPMSQTMTPVLL
ncbi:MAG: hypothetical protein P4K94_09075, partial [Terracidiphilus sp.]|nr:hypothetical protein [Terracidiphilus sp.]